MNNFIHREKLEKHLKERGRTIFDNGATARSPKRMFHTISEEIINVLDFCASPISVNEISNYLGFNYKQTNNALKRLLSFKNSSRYISKVKTRRSTLYSADFPKIGIPSIYELLKSDIDSADNNMSSENFPKNIMDLLKSGEIEIIIRKKSS